jgi:hypothetical protein
MVSVIATIIAMLNASNPISSADSPRRAWVRSVIGMDNPVLCHVVLPTNRPASDPFQPDSKNSVHYGL